MDEYKIEHLSDILFEHMLVGTIFYTHRKNLDIDTIEELCAHANITKLSPHIAIANLVSHGIVSAKIKHGKLYYQITEFGKYFFHMFCKTNPNAKEICKKVQGYAK